MPALVIPIHDLDSFGKDFVFSLDASWLRTAFGDTGVRGDITKVGSVEVHAQRNGTEILVHGRARAWLLAECVRCLQDLPVEVSCELAALFTPNEGGQKREGFDFDKDETVDVDPDEPDREFYTGDQVVIDDLVRDYLLLELPMQPRCDLGWKCPNLDIPDHMRGEDGVKSGEGFGEDEIDPRLMPLKKLAQVEPTRGPSKPETKPEKKKE